MAEPTNEQQEKPKSLWHKFLDSRLRSEMGAMWLEALKDVNDKMHQVFFSGQQAGPGAIGTPLEPTSQEVTASRGGVHGAYQAKLDAVVPRAEEQSRGNER